jgi:hypothetical protein
MNNHQYFAQIDENNIVIDVAVVTREFMAENPDRYPGTWVETFINVPGKNYASVGYIYDFDTKNFVFPTVVVPPTKPDNAA